MRLEQYGAALLTILSLPGSFCSSQDPRLTPAPFPNQARQALPTITITNPSGWFDTKSAAPSGLDPSSIHVTSDTVGGKTQVQIGKSLASSAQAAAKSNCPQIGDGKCMQSIEDGLNPGQALQLQPRIAPLFLTIGAFVAILSYVYTSTRLNDDFTNHDVIHLDVDPYSSLVDVQASPTVVFASASQDSNRVTVVLKPSATSLNGSIELSTSGSSTFIVVPTALDGPIHSDLKTSGTAGLCQPTAAARARKRHHDIAYADSDHKMQRRDQSFAWMDAVGPANALWGDVAPGRPLELIGTAFNLQFPNWQPIVAAALQLVIEAGKQAAGALGLSAIAIDTAAVVLYFIALNAQICLPRIRSKYLMPSEAVADTPTQSARTSSTTQSSKCPPPIKKPNCENCGGTAAPSVCAGIKTESNLYASCSCFGQAIPLYTPFPNSAAWTSAMNAAKSFLAMDAKPTSTHIESTEPKTSASSPASVAPTKPSLSPPVCNEYKDEQYKGCFKSIDEKKVNKTIDALRMNMVQVVMERVDGLYTSSVGNVSQCYDADKGVSYIANIGHVPDCTEFLQQNVKWPEQLVGLKDLESVDEKDRGYSSDEIAYQSWRNCRNNKGLGGYIDIGCMRIGFYPTRVKGVFNSPPNYPKYFDDMKYC